MKEERKEDKQEKKELKRNERIESYQNVIVKTLRILKIVMGLWLNQKLPKLLLNQKKKNCGRKQSNRNIIFWLIQSLGISSKTNYGNVAIEKYKASCFAKVLSQLRELKILISLHQQLNPNRLEFYYL